MSFQRKVIVTQRIAADIVARLAVLLDLGLGYPTLERQHAHPFAR